MAPSNHNSFTELDGYFRAANFLTVGQIYLRENPLLREPLRPEHIKPRQGMPEISEFRWDGG